MSDQPLQDPRELNAQWRAARHERLAAQRGVKALKGMRAYIEHLETMISERDTPVMRQLRRERDRLKGEIAEFDRTIATQARVSQLLDETEGTR